MKKRDGDKDMMQVGHPKMLEKGRVSPMHLAAQGTKGVCWEVVCAKQIFGIDEGQNVEDINKTPLLKNGVASFHTRSLGNVQTREFAHYPRES